MPSSEYSISKRALTFRHLLNASSTAVPEMPCFFNITFANSFVTLTISTTPCLILVDYTSFRNIPSPQLCTNLRPPLLDHLGLGAAIEWQCKDFRKRSGVKCEVALASDEITVDGDITTTLFRVFQEALTNVLKHS